MQNLRALRQRIRSVQNTQKITRAMQMVAGAKLRRSHEELMAFRPYADRLEEVAGRFLSAHPGLEHPLLGNDVIARSPEGTTKPSAFRDGIASGAAHPRNDAPAGLIVIASDTGLCGTYNERILGLAGRFLQEFPSARVVTIGRKGNRWLVRRGIPRCREVLDWGGRFDPDRVQSFVEGMKELFLRGEVSSWVALYTRFISALQFKPAEAILLPVVPESVPGADLPDQQIAEPDVDRFAEQLLNRFVQNRFSRILLEAFTSEHSARMVAMKNATENASQMIDTLTLVRNKARQAAITKEIIEVVSGAQALQ